MLRSRPDLPSGWARLGLILALAPLPALLLLPAAAGQDVTVTSSKFHAERTIDEVTVDYYHFTVDSSEDVSFTVSVKSGFNLDIYLVDESEVFKVRLGQSFLYYVDASDLNSRGTVGSATDSGDYAVVLATPDSTPGTSTYTIDMRTTSTASEDVATLIGCAVLAVIVLAVIGVGVVVRQRRQRLYGPTGMAPPPGAPTGPPPPYIAPYYGPQPGMQQGPPAYSAPAPYSGSPMVGAYGAPRMSARVVGQSAEVHKRSKQKEGIP